MVSDDQALLSWIAVAWVVLALCQLAVTVAGNLAVLPLTGVTFPFVSFGMTSLVVNMLMLGLRHQRQRTVASLRWLRNARRRCSNSRSPLPRPSCRFLLLVLVMVGIAHPIAPSSAPARNADRHVSVRHLAALKTFERAIVRRTSVQVGPPSAILLLDRVPQVPPRVGRQRRHARSRSPRARRPGATPPSPAQRLAAQLADLDDALLRFSTGDNRRVSEAVGFDSARWFDAVATAMQVPIEAAEYPGRKFTVQCADIASAATMLARSNGRMLAALSWRGTEVERVMAHWRPEQFVEVSARQVARANPWRGLPGCIFMGTRRPPAACRCPRTSSRRRARRTSGSARARRCTTPPTTIAKRRRRSAIARTDRRASAERRAVESSAFARRAVQSLATLRQPSGSLYRLYTETAAEADATPTGYRYGPNRIEIGGTPVDVGFSVDLTIDPRYRRSRRRRSRATPVGRTSAARSACRGARTPDARSARDAREGDGAHGRDRGDRRGHRAHRGARRRALAVHAQEYDGPGRGKGCDKRMPYTPRYRPDALLNPRCSTMRCRAR
jgi:hypothetical protein